MYKMHEQILYADPLDLQPYENNPRINDYAVKKVMESIDEFGFRNPIIVDKDMVIIAGHTRREASILLGLTEVPYIVAEDMTPEQVKAFRIADNKLAELAVWDNDKLLEELWDLQEADFSLEVLGFTSMELTTLFEEEEEEAEAEIDDTPHEEKTTLPMLRFGSNSVRITTDELTLLSNRYNEYVEATPEEGFITWLLKRGL
jgi:ParB-like chromosome segregation protein Spo0J